MREAGSRGPLDTARHRGRSLEAGLSVGRLANAQLTLQSAGAYR
jgi:hypothetical protein